MAQYQNAKLLLLAKHLVPNDNSLVEEINLAINTPDKYITRFQRRLIERGISDPLQHYPLTKLLIRFINRFFKNLSIYKRPLSELPWIALLDGLIARNQLVEIDWKSEVEDVSWSIDQLLQAEPENPDRWSWTKTVIWDEKSTEELLKAIAYRFKGQGLALVYLDIDSDSYPLMFIKTERLASCKKMANEAGYGHIVAL